MLKTCLLLLLAQGASVGSMSSLFQIAAYWLAACKIN